MAAGVLIMVSKVEISTTEMVLIPLSCLSIGFLLYLQREFSSTLSGKKHADPLPRTTAAGHSDADKPLA